MNATQWAAWVGASSGVAGLLWNIYTKLTAGPKLILNAFGGVIRDPDYKSSPRHIKIVLQNRGNAPTTITDVRFYGYSSRWNRLRQKEPHHTHEISYQGPPYPRPLQVGGDWIAFVEQDKLLQDLVDTGDLWVEITHSFSRRRAQARIRPFER